MTIRNVMPSTTVIRKLMEIFNSGSLSRIRSPSLLGSPESGVPWIARRRLPVSLPTPPTKPKLMAATLGLSTPAKNGAILAGLGRGR